MPHVCWCWGWSPRPSPYWGTTYAVRDKVQRASPWDSGMGTHGGGRRLRFVHGRVHLLTCSHVVGLLGSPGKQGRYASAFSSGQWVSLIPREYCSRSEAGAGGQLAGEGCGDSGAHSGCREESEVAWSHLRGQAPPCWEPENSALGHRQP